MPDDNQGLTSKRAKELLGKHGPNKLPEKPPPSDISIFLSQIKSPLVYILLFAGLVTFFLGHLSDTVIILLAVLINTVLGFFQERKAGRALYELKKLIHPQAFVIRDGKRKEIDAEKIVPGDVCILASGDKIPADGKLIAANRLFVEEAILTGESLPVEKEKDDEAFMGTIVSSGQGKLLVKVTGKHTKMGEIAIGIQSVEEDTPLRRQLSKFSKQLSYLVIFLTLFVFVVGALTGKNLDEIFTTSVALAVSSIPEGLLVGLTVVLAIGMQRILSRKGLVRNLVSAETLGGVTTICVDKTGTLTKGQMQVTKIKGNERHLAKQALIANDRDDPVVVALWEWANKKLKSKDLKSLSINDYLKKHTRYDSIPFNSKTRYFVSLNKLDNENNIIYVNGAPEYLLKWSKLSKKRQKEISDQIDSMTSQGMRLVGMARKKISSRKKKVSEKDIKSLEWVGIVGFADPVREGVKEAFAKTKKAGIKLLVITGDYAQTAMSVLNQLSIQTETVIMGSELEKMKKTELTNKLANAKNTILFARTTPDQKLKIVTALKKKGEVVAMMGDGVNDAPAIKKADIGIVVDSASDVSKETADMVLLDSSFETIVAAIEEGRGIFDNIRKIILYLMSDAFEEIVAVVATIIFGLPLAVTAVQILWINLVSDGFPHLALTVDPKREGIMESLPRSPQETLVTGWMKTLITIVSLTGGGIAFFLFYYFLNTTGDIQLARSIAFATLGINSLVYVFSVRTLKDPFWRENPFDNKWLNLAIFAGLFFQVVPFVTSFGRELLDVSYLHLNHWTVIFFASLVMFIIIEVLKGIFHIKFFAKRL